MSLVADCFPRIGDGVDGEFVTFRAGARGNNFAGKPRPMESENRREPPARTQLGNPIWIIENSWEYPEYLPACRCVREFAYAR